MPEENNSLYNLLYNNISVEDGVIVVKLSKDAIKRIWEDYSKIEKRQVNLKEGRYKTKPLYPDLNDFMVLIHEKANRMN